MFFERRRWALRVIERMGLRARDPIATELVDMMITGANMYKDMMRGTAGAKITQPELVLMAVAAMSDNRSAFDRLQGEGLDAEQLLAEVREAGRRLAVENGFDTLVTRFYDRLPEVNAEVLAGKPAPDKAMANFRRQVVEENLTAARKMPSDTRALMVRDLLVTYSQIDDNRVFDKKISTLQGILTFALKRKNDASQNGDESPDNPLWNVASCIENIAHTEIAALKKQEMGGDALALRGLLERFMSENLP